MVLDRFLGHFQKQMSQHFLFLKVPICDLCEREPSLAMVHGCSWLNDRVDGDETPDSGPSPAVRRQAEPFRLVSVR